MLYNSFRVIMMIVSFLGMLSMFVNAAYAYLLFPIAIMVWGLFSFFDENDREYLRRNGMNWQDDDTRHYYSSSYSQSSGNTSTYQPYQKYKYNNPEYKALLPKMKKSCKITIVSSKENIN